MTELEKVPFDMKLEVVLLGVSDVDRAKAFYENLGWRLDIDIAAGDFRGVQMTPHNSEASIIFGKGITSAKPGSAGNLILAVDEIDAARADIYRKMQVRMETEIRQAFYPIQKFDYSITGERVQGLWPSPIYQGRLLAEVWLADAEP